MNAVGSIPRYGIRRSHSQKPWNRGRYMRITKKVFTDLAIYMILLGVIVGVVFPFFVMLFGVPRAIVCQPLFFAACIGAGILLAAMNIALARRTVGVRVRQLSKEMKHVEGILSTIGHENGCETCTPDTCQIPVDSEDELGESAESFNRLIRTLSAVLKQQNGMQQFSEMLTSHLELEVLAGRTLESLLQSTQASGGAVLIESNGEFSAVASLAVHDLKKLETNELLLHVMKTRERYIVEYPADIVMDGAVVDYHPAALLIEPLVYKQVLLGIIVLAGIRPFTAESLEMLTAYAPILSMAFNNAITHQQMQRLAALDSLTGIYNRRFGISRIQEEFSRSIRSGTAVSLVMLDIDHFKLVNDTYGHVVGDKIIVSITKTISSAIREGDVLIRYGGEEFLCILPGANLHDAQQIAERIRIMVGDSTLKWGEQEVRVTVSLGTATYPNRNISDVQQFICTADEAMYSAKNMGRNRVVSV